MTIESTIPYKKLLTFWFAISATWGLYRLLDLPEFFSEVIAKPAIWLGITALFVMIGFIPIKVIETLKSDFTSTRPIWKIFLLPALFIVFYFYLINFRQVGYPEFSLSVLLLTLIINFSTGIVEEIVYRGFLYVWLLQKTHEVSAFFIVQVLFLLAHVPILFLSSGSAAETITRVLFILILGAIHTTVFRLTKSIYASSLTHGIWNSLVYFFLLVS